MRWNLCTAGLILPFGSEFYKILSEKFWIQFIYLSIYIGFMLKLLCGYKISEHKPDMEPLHYWINFTFWVKALKDIEGEILNYN